MPSHPSAHACLWMTAPLPVKNLVEGDAAVRQPQQPGEPALAVLDRLAPDVFAVHFEEVERTQDRPRIGGRGRRMRSNTARPPSSQTIASPSITHDRTGNSSIAAAARREAVRKVVAVAGEKPNVAPAPVRQDPEAVVLDLVNPGRTRRRLAGRSRQARIKAGKGLLRATRRRSSCVTDIAPKIGPARRSQSRYRVPHRPVTGSSSTSSSSTRDRSSLTIGLRRGGRWAECDRSLVVRQRRLQLRSKRLPCSRLAYSCVYGAPAGNSRTCPWTWKACSRSRSPGKLAAIWRPRRRIRVRRCSSVLSVISVPLFLFWGD